MDEFGGWHDQADSILIEVWMQIQPISGIKKRELFSQAEVCSLPSAIVVLPVAAEVVCTS